MPGVHACECRRCRTGDPQTLEAHQRINWFFNRLNTEQRRFYSALESLRFGEAGDRVVSEITGMGEKSITRGREEIAAHLAGRPPEKAHGRPGRPATEAKYPGIERVLGELIGDEVAGDPTGKTAKKWVRVSTRALSRQLKAKGYEVSYHTVWRLLRQMGVSLRLNLKKRAAAGHSPKRDAQFKYIAAQRQGFLARGLPIISVDTKKKELIGNFRAAGRAWCKDPIRVEEHSFASLAECVATPYGVYDTTTNKGYVYVNTSGNTPAFAVSCIARWWGHAGRHVYPDASKLLVLADGGGGNGCRVKAWKHRLQVHLCDALGLSVTVCHYPPGCSKYNPVERRLFSHISNNWAGKPLRTLETMLGYIRGTTTETGLVVEAFLVTEDFPTGERVSAGDMRRLALAPHSENPEWNYTVTPRGAR
jgi:hypothetical protein